MLTKKEILVRANLEELAGRYAEMADSMEQVIKHSGDLSVEELNLLSLAYKNIVDPLRFALRIVNNQIRKDEERDQTLLEADKMFHSQLTKELRAVCKTVIRHLSGGSVKYSPKAEAEALFLKLKADYFRYLSEVETGDDKTDAIGYSLIAYKQASSVAASSLRSSDPVRLGIALNFATLYHDTENSADLAIKHAKAAFDAAVAELDILSEDPAKETVLVMQLLRDSIRAWLNENKEGLSDGCTQTKQAETAFRFLLPTGLLERRKSAF
ncbi:unnamed protein product [Calicophoron daubneyi]|uniref:14-3-3 domain-containing protein n=1 Tax=Calicophoron daubneyi TaxID=300641 RepID=A0AAV2TE20_CALDB